MEGASGCRAVDRSAISQQLAVTRRWSSIPRTRSVYPGASYKKYERLPLGRLSLRRPLHAELCFVARTLIHSSRIEQAVCEHASSAVDDEGMSVSWRSVPHRCAVSLADFSPPLSFASASLSTSSAVMDVSRRETSTAARSVCRFCDTHPETHAP